MTERTALLAGRSAIVTGGAAGIGQAAALALAAAGAAVVVADINPDGAARTAAQIVTAGGRALDVHADVSNRFQAANVIEQARDAFGKLDVLVNAAGVYKRGGVALLDEWDWRRIVDVNLTGTFFMTQLTARVMGDEGGGAIVNLTSSAPTLPEGAAYLASKAAVLALTRQCAREYAPLRVRVNAVASTVDEDLPADVRVGTPQEAAAAILYLCSDDAQHVSGQALSVPDDAPMYRTLLPDNAPPR